MNSSSLRRLASDHSSLHKDGLPPNYLFPSAADHSSLPDDLTQLTVLITGTHGTPYSQGLWRLHLKMPEDYPKSPPKASFRTRIWHPNVEESTGAVCVDTLKRDWESKLTLRDILITISCLLIHPNPDSALNAAAGSLLQDDYEAFARQAKLMTSIHAPIPKDVKEAVQEAKRRGEDGDVHLKEEENGRPVAPRSSSSTSSVIMKKRPQPIRPESGSLRSGTRMGITMSETSNPGSCPSSTEAELSDDDEDHDPAKENDPSLSPSPVSFAPPSPRKNILGKRPLSSLPTPVDPECDILDEETQDDIHRTASEKNIAANQAQTPQPSSLSKESGPPKKSPKLTELSKGVNASGRLRDDEVEIHEDNDDVVEVPTPPIGSHGEEKENFTGSSTTATACASSTSKDAPSTQTKKAIVSSNASAIAAAVSKPTSRKVSTASTSSAGGNGKGKARVGVRRL